MPKKKTKSTAASAPSKKAKKESPSEIIEGYQLEMIEKLKKERRGNATAEIDIDGEVDDDRFNILFSTVRALIDTNNEIWKRCLPYKKKGSNGMLRFYRLGYLTVAAAKNDDSKDMEFSAQLKLEVEDFAAFPCLPRILSNTVPFEKETDGSFTNYVDYLIKISCLVKPVAYHSFSIFKDHLEDIQVALGKIETWITGSKDATNFINDNFGSNLEVPDLGDVKTANKSYYSDTSSVCAKCFQRKDEHNCMYSTYYCRNQGIWGISPPARCSFIWDHSVPLKKVPTTTSGSMDMSFKVSSEADQERFTQFMKSVQS